MAIAVARRGFNMHRFSIIYLAWNVDIVMVISKEGGRGDDKRRKL
jgi:hypothetical protein